MYSRTSQAQSKDHPIPNIQRLKIGDVQERRRHESLNSNISEISYECSLSDSDSEGSNDTGASASSVDADSSYSFEEIVEEDDDTFYTQSCRLYADNELSEETATCLNIQNLLKSGVRLNAAYLQKFEDKRPDVINRNTFYTDALSEPALKEKLLQNPQKYIPCVIQTESPHEAFCYPIDTKQGYSVIEISGRSKIGQVFNEDEVVVEILDDKATNDKRFGKVLGVLNRQRHKDISNPVFICTLDDMESHLVRPMCKTVPKIHIVNKEITEKCPKFKRFRVEVYDYDQRAGELCNPKIIDVNPAGQKTYVFLVALIGWSPRHIYPLGAIIRILPCGTSLQRGLAILNLQHDVPSLYKKETVDRVEAMTRRGVDEPDALDMQGRLDLTSLNTFTIDPPGSTDLDDALSVESCEGGYKVGVHIADVSYYVQKNDPVDEEARERATTFYPGIRRPRSMIPEPLSSNLCSLLPGKTRLTLSVFIFVTSEGRPMQMMGENVVIRESYILSKRKFSYGEVQNIISSQGQDDQISKDVCRLFKLAKQIRERRLGKSMFAVQVDWEENVEGESLETTAEAHYLVEEFMLWANKKVADRLIRAYPKCVPLRCQPPPNKEELDEFIKKNDLFIDILVRLQDKTIAGQPRGLDNILSGDSNNCPKVMVPKDLWENIKREPEFAVRCLQQDDMFPLQHVVYQHWLSVQEKAAYRCSGSVDGKNGGQHFSLSYYPYTHFTSPIRRYNDLVIHRLLRACLRREGCPYTKTEIDDICTHITSATKKSKDYQKGCKSLQQVLEFSSESPMITCFLDNINDRGMTLCSPLFRYVKKAHRELPFRLLDMGFKPEVTEDTTTKWDIVKATWRKRVYDHRGSPAPYPPDRGNTLTLNPNRNMVYIPISVWARLLGAAVDCRVRDFRRMLSSASAQSDSYGLDDISTECLDPQHLQPSTKFSMSFSRGQAVSVQMSAALSKGILVPKPMIYKMTNNVNFCLLHTDDPVLHLYHYVTSSTCDQYRNVKHYLERWMPLILMEAATGIVKNEESCYIHNVPIKFSSGRSGKFALSLAHCETRNIELSGTKSDEESDGDGDDLSYDWLCIKAPFPPSHKQTCQDLVKQPTQQRYWLGHAEVTCVKKKKSSPPSGKLIVNFELHEKSGFVPNEIMHSQPETKFSVEILRKTEVDR